MNGEREGRKRMRETEGKKNTRKERKEDREIETENREEETSWKSFQINVEMINRTTQGQKMYVWCGQGHVCFRWLCMCVCLFVCTRACVCVCVCVCE